MAESDAAGSEPLPPVPIWPLWLASVLVVAASVAYEAEAPGRNWLLLAAMLLLVIAIWRHQGRALKAGYEPPASDPLDTWDGGGMGGPW